MSSTRTAKDNSVFHQSRFASSPEFERGLLANLVAKRAALLTAKADIELVWALHYLSHQPGGLGAIAKELLTKYPDWIQTEEMAAMKLKRGKICNAEQVRKIRSDMPEEIRCHFPLKGERTGWGDEILEALCERSSRLAEGNQNPSSYPASDFFEECLSSAQRGLEKFISEICLNPASSLDAGPWYFPRLIQTLREYVADYMKAKSAGVVVTALGAKIYDVLEYTFYCRGLTLVIGDARRGKSFAGNQWVMEHLGRARFIEVPTGNDEASFFRALARGLGLGNFLNYKVAEIRERVESVLLTGAIGLVLDEGQRLFPSGNGRYFSPTRINWLMAMANRRIPICVIATPQFLEIQKFAAKKYHWNAAQLTGRIAHFEPLPSDLEPGDLMAVAKAVLPEADSKVLRVLATYARSSERYLAAIETITKRARFIAMRDGRANATTADVRKAMRESAIPADSKLMRALELERTNKRAEMPAQTPDVLPMPDEERPPVIPPARGIRPAASLVEV